mmetsp:Transcript_93395/g.241400  ORF Transcript_93395/g.241400 Transcript_93395/m.241400 type:complete len:275 (-) Transcript_93395:376-1200(-)
MLREHHLLPVLEGRRFLARPPRHGAHKLQPLLLLRGLVTLALLLLRVLAFGRCRRGVRLAGRRVERAGPSSQDPDVALEVARLHQHPTAPHAPMPQERRQALQLEWRGLRADAVLQQELDCLGLELPMVRPQREGVVFRSQQEHHRPLEAEDLVGRVGVSRQEPYGFALAHEVAARGAVAVAVAVHLSLDVLLAVLGTVLQRALERRGAGAQAPRATLPGAHAAAQRAALLHRRAAAEAAAALQHDVVVAHLIALLLQHLALAADGEAAPAEDL